MDGRESATVIAEAANDWVVRLDRGLSSHERGLFDAWIEADPRHHGALVRARALWFQADRGRIYRANSPADVREPARSFRWRTSSRWAAAAAVAVLALAGTLFAWQQYSATHLSTTVGEIRHVPLADGSIVTLNTQSQIALEYSRGVRLIRLEHGEVLFEVAHDATRPFIVEAGALRVRAVGTAFVVRCDDHARAEVTVTRGIVDVWRQTSIPEPPIRLAAGLRAVASRTALTSAQHLSDTQVARAIAWQDGAIDLEGRTLADAAVEFNRYNRQKIVIDDPALGRERVIGRFNAGDPLGFARAAAAMFGAQARTEDGLIILQTGASR